jgi:predicted esterase
VWRAARCWSSWTTSLAAVLVLAGCGAGWQPEFISKGTGQNQYWVLHSKGKARAVVVFLHGLGADSGEQLEPWQAHLGEEGYDVIYPRYEQPPPNAQARDTIVTATRRALADLGHPKVPLVLLGHSRGGRLAVEAAAYLHPRLVLAFYPGLINPAFEPDTNLRLIPKTTQIWLFAGDRDKSVGPSGVVELDQRMLNDRFNVKQVHNELIHSRGFVADHMSVYDLSKAAKRAIWGRADTLIEDAITG